MERMLMKRLLPLCLSSSFSLRSNFPHLSSTAVEEHFTDDIEEHTDRAPHLLLCQTPGLDGEPGDEGDPAGVQENDCSKDHKEDLDGEALRVCHTIRGAKALSVAR